MRREVIPKIIIILFWPDKRIFHYLVKALNGISSDTHLGLGRTASAT